MSKPRKAALLSPYYEVDLRMQVDSVISEDAIREPLNDGHRMTLDKPSQLIAFISS